MLRADEDPELLVFDPVIRFFHWLTLFLVATIFVLAFSIDFASSKEEAVALIQLHRSFGVTVWVVMLARLVWRQFSRFPNWPADMPQATRFVAQWSEYALYALMLTQPIVGPIRPIRLDLGLDIGAIFSGRGLDDCSLERSEYKRDHRCPKDRVAGRRLTGLRWVHTGYLARPYCRDRQPSGRALTL
jgi:hypothetical protein